jgi:hypothetical protein
MAWSDDALKARVKARCRELGRSVRSTLLEAGLTPDLFEKPPSAGRRIDTLEKLCGPLEWSLQQVMGFEIAPRISPELMVKLYPLVRRALRNLPDPDQDMPFALATAYNALLAFGEGGAVVDDSALAMLAATIGEEFGATRRRR